MNTILPMNAQQLEEYSRLCSICFSYPYQPAKEPPTEQQLASTRVALDESGDMLGGMTAHDFTVNFCGQDVRMAGIGGVVTYPEKRRGGAIRSIFEVLLPQLYEQGYVFSALYPFSHAFYRKFGYEFCFERRRCTFHNEALALVPTAGRMRMLRPGDDLQPLLDVYEQYRKRMNFTFVRTEKDFEPHLKKDPAVDFHAVYLWQNDTGEPQGYVVLQTQVHGENDKSLEVQELAYTTREALSALLVFLRGFNSYREFIVPATPLEDWRALAPEAYDVKEQVACAGMARVVNVQKALSLLPCPPIDGRLTLRVKDEQIAQNNQSLAICCRGGALTVTETDQAPEMTISVQALAQLMSGRLSLETLRFSSRHEGLDCDNPLLPYLFAQRLCWMNRYF